MNGALSSWRRLGNVVDAGTPERRTSAVLLAIGVAVLTLVMMFAGIIIGAYQQRVERDFARLPTGYFTAPDPVMNGPRWRIINDRFGDRWVDVIVVIPGSHSVLPPGLSRWPDPGSIALAPALRGTAAERVLEARYGPVMPEPIGDSGVVSLTERLVYYRPPTAEEPQISGYPLDDGYGPPYPVDATSSGRTGGALRQRPLSASLTGYCVAIVLPGLVLLLVASRIGSELRDRRLQILATMGAGPRQSLAMLWGTVGRPVMLGGTIALAALGGLCIIDMPIPAAAFTLRADDVRASLPLVLPLGVAGWLLSTVLVLLANRPRPNRGTRPRIQSRPDRPSRLLALPIACAAYTALLSATLSWEDSTPRIFIIYLGTLAVALTLPGFVGATTSLTARLMTKLGTRTGTPSLIVAGRQLLHDPRAVRRLAAALALIVVLMAQALILSSLTNSATRNAQAIHHALGDSAINVAGNLDTAQQKQALRTALRERGGLVNIEDSARTVITATCPTLTALSLPCHNGPIGPAVMERDRRLGLIDTSRKNAVIRVGDPLAAHHDMDQLITMSLDGKDLPMDAIKHDLVHAVIPTPDVDPFGMDWLVGLRDARDLARWNTVGAGAATIMVALAITGAVLGDGSLLARRTGVLGMWGARPRFAIALATSRVLIPLVLATVIGGITALIASAPLTLPPLSAEIPNGYFIVTLALPLLASLAVTALGLRAQITELENWQPRTQTRD